MRTAVLLAKGHDGKWTMLSSPDVSILEQKQAFKQFLGSRSHPKYDQVMYQESDAHARILNFRSPNEQKAHDIQRAKENAQFTETALRDARSEEALRNQASDNRKKDEQRIRGLQDKPAAIAPISTLESPKPSADKQDAKAKETQTPADEIKTT